MVKQCESILWFIEKYGVESHRIISVLIPEINEMVGFNQNNPYHHLDVWNHTVTAISNVSNDNIIRLVMLLHDIGKPRSYTEDERGGHFYGHPKVSADMAKDILERLECDSDTASMVIELVLQHDVEINPSKKSVRRWLNRLGKDQFERLLEVKIADAKAQSPEFNKAKLAKIQRVYGKLSEVIEEESVFKLKDLAVNGKDLIDIGIPQGKELGFTLNHLMNMVVNGEIENDKEDLLKIVGKKFS